MLCLEEDSKLRCHQPTYSLTFSHQQPQFSPVHPVCSEPPTAKYSVPSLNKRMPSIHSRKKGTRGNKTAQRPLLSTRPLAELNRLHRICLTRCLVTQKLHDLQTSRQIRCRSSGETHPPPACPFVRAVSNGPEGLLCLSMYFPSCSCLRGTLLSTRSPHVSRLFSNWLAFTHGLYTTSAEPFRGWCMISQIYPSRAPLPLCPSATLPLSRARHRQDHRAVGDDQSVQIPTSTCPSDVYVWKGASRQQSAFCRPSPTVTLRAQPLTSPTTAALSARSTSRRDGLQKSHRDSAS